MNLDSQDWFIVIGALLIVGVLLDAWRRYRSDRRNPIRMARKTMGPGGGFARDEVDFSGSELPVGGARVINREADPVEPSPKPTLNRRFGARTEPRIEAAPAVPPASVPAAVSVSAPASADELPVPSAAVAEHRAFEPSDAIPGVVSAAVTPEPVPPQPARVAAPPAAPAGAEQGILLIRVVSRGDGGFLGADLARIFKECDVRSAAERVYQRTELAKGEGAVQFTVFNATAQGVFETALEEGFITRGLGFLMRLGSPAKPLEAFDCMLETARAVAKYCDGELRDESNSVFTQQTGEHCRERIRDFAMRARSRR